MAFQHSHPPGVVGDEASDGDVGAYAKFTHDVAARAGHGDPAATQDELGLATVQLHLICRESFEVSLIPCWDIGARSVYVHGHGLMGIPSYLGHVAF